MEHKVEEGFQENGMVAAKLDEEDTQAVETELDDGDASSDECFKRVFSNRNILAVLIKYTVPVYRELSIDEIVSLIRNVAPGADGLSPGTANVRSNEISHKNEHTVKYDILADVLLPETYGKEHSTSSSIQVNIRFDLEMQRKYKPGYDLGKRAVYYSSRLISAQKKSIGKKTVYYSLQQVYTVWITLVPHTYDLVNQKAAFRLQCDSPGFDSSQMDEVKDLEEKMDLIRIVFLFVDKDVLENKYVHEGMDSAVEFVSLLFAKLLRDTRMAKYVSVWDKNLEKEVISMSARMLELEEERREAREEGWEEGRKEGREEGREEGIIKCGRKHSLSDEDIIGDLMTEAGYSYENARKVLDRYCSI